MSGLEFITLCDTNGRTSSLSIGGRTTQAGFMGVTGNLEHCAQIRPDTEQDRQRLISFLTSKEVRDACRFRTLTPEEQAERASLRQRNDAHNAERRKLMAARGPRCSYVTAEESKQLEALFPFTNAERSRLEVLDFIADPPARYFAYVQERSPAVSDAFNGTPLIQKVTTWVGDVLGRITWEGTPFKIVSTFGEPSVRINFRFIGINGRTYAGTYYKSSGNYCRVREVKP